MSDIGHNYLVGVMEFILIYDMPTELESVQRQTHRLLTRDARILEERFVF